jgi:ABC-type transporter Mla maintaining outer membrane lipid asymmetry ATPase subunit MlaF
MTAPRRPAALEFVEVYYHDPHHQEPLLERIDFAIAPGEAVALIGPAGSGKSTALGLVLGACRASNGEVLVLGHDPAVLSLPELTNLRTRVGYLAQQGTLLSNLSLLDNLALPLRYHRDAGEAEARAAMTAACELVDLELDDLPRVQPALASLEMRQLVAMAKALVLEPAILLIDEPTAGLAGNAAREFWRLLAQVRARRDLAVLIATNDPATGRAVADRTIALPPRHDASRLRRSI